ncbi:MAG: hypothetical protein RRC34_13800 [Lentisphaeria bacterium]|nr:hypothetical protein [Lentisphaeria bacterium]
MKKNKHYKLAHLIVASTLIALFCSSLVCFIQRNLFWRIKMVTPSEAISAPIPFSRLVAYPEKFEGRMVATHGYLTAEFENTAIFFSSEHADNFIASEAIWLDISYEEISEEAGNYILVRGIFTTSGKGHMGSYSGSLLNPEICLVLP